MRINLYIFSFNKIKLKFIILIRENAMAEKVRLIIE